MTRRYRELRRPRWARREAEKVEPTATSPDALESLVEDTAKIDLERTRAVSPDEPLVDTAPVEVEELELCTGEPTPCLVIVSGPESGRVVFLDTRYIRIGRDPQAELRINEVSISRFHAMVHLDDDGMPRIRDLGSTNGTFVNGRIVQTQELLAGDRIQIGQHITLRLDFLPRDAKELLSRQASPSDC